MKKLFTLIAIALPMMVLTACDDNDDTPNVSIKADIVGVVEQGDALYGLNTQLIEVKSVNLINHSTKDAVIGSVTYYWDGYRIGTAIAPPYGMTIDTADIPVGVHLLQMEMPIFAVDYPVSSGVVSYKVVIVDDESQLPQTDTTIINPTVSGKLVTKN